MSGPTFRDMTLSDFGFYDQCESDLHRLHQEARPDLFKPCPHFPKKRFQMQFDEPSVQLFLAEIDGAPVGMCVLELHQIPESHPLVCENTSAYISDIYVVESFRRQGVATALYREAVRRSKKLGAKRLELMVWPFNKSALAFYEGLGFTVRSYNLETKL